MKTIVIYSPYKCLIKCGQQEIEIDENEHALIDNLQEKIYIYPLGKTKRYSFIIDINDKNSQFYSIIEKENKVLIFLLDGLLSENIDIYNVKYNNIDTQVEVSQNKISFSSKKHKKNIFLFEKPSKVKIGNFHHIIFALLKFNEKDVLIAYNCQDYNARQFSGDKINLTKNGFNILTKNSGNYLKIEQEYYVDTQGLKNKEKSFTLSEQSLPEELIPYQFMSSIKNGDDYQIENLLSEELKKQITLENIKKYFGKISYFYMIDSTNCFAISNGENIIYEFFIKNGKITEIVDNK